MTQDFNDKHERPQIGFETLIAAASMILTIGGMIWNALT